MEGVVDGATVSLEEGTLIDAIGRHAARRPDAPALIGERTLSYGELWAQAGRLAADLTQAGVEPGDQVAVWATRTAPVVAAAIAAMSLGAAFLPIDPTYPAARVRRILEVGGPRVMVCPDERALTGSLPRLLPTVDIHGRADAAGPIDSAATSEGVAYTVFTSGSSGLPKGVLVGHAALVNYLAWAADLTKFGEDDATPCFASLGFDHAVTCLWLPLYVGGAVQLIPDSWDPRPWLAPRERPYAFIKITPSHVRLFERIAHPDYRSVTRTVMFGGERLDAALVAGLGERLEGVRLLNHYGPTEATVGCTALVFDSASVPGEGALPIGRPVWNSSAMVLDEGGEPVGAGEEGELVLAGACVAEGYLGGTDEDRARFCEIGGRRAYRTGDRAEILDGVVHYRGRLDEQVKVRGHRIEIQEVHDLAVSVDSVAQAAVRVTTDGLGSLELFVVPEGDGGDPVAEVLEFLRENLPAAAVPSKVWIVPELVANTHGKWDPDATRALAKGKS